ncbi:MAG: hypothetical protein Kow0047_06300 [Anaerolineae bacterium]
MAHRSAIPGPEDIFRTTLPNGMVLLVRENHTSPVVIIDGYLQVGSLHEPPELAGLAAFVAPMLMRGTEKRSFTQINEEIESVGASLSFGAGRDTTDFSGQCLAEDLPLLIDILDDVLRHPTFPEEHVERVRGQKLTALQERNNDTRRVAGIAFREMLYPEGHPYRRMVEGDPETVQAIRRDDLIAFYRDHFTPQGGAIAVVGDVQAQEVADLLAETIGRWQPPASNQSVEVPPVPPLSEVRRKAVSLEGKTQTDLVLGVPALSRLDPDFYAATVANSILGVFGMYGRLGERVREQQGLAYYAYSALSVDKHAGVWVAIAGVAPQNVQRTIDSILDEIERMRREPVPEEELADVKAFLTGSLPLRLETNAGVSSAILEMEWFGLGFDFLQRYPDLINQVTAERVQEVVSRYLRTDAYALGIAGPSVEG